MQQVDVPIYDFITHHRSTETRRVEAADVVIIEGIMVLHMKEVREMLNMKIFVDTDDDVRLARRYGRQGVAFLSYPALPCCLRWKNPSVHHALSAF